MANVTGVVRGSEVREWSQSTEEVAQRAGALEPTHHTSHIGVGYQWMASLSVMITYILMAMTTIEYGKHRAPNQVGGWRTPREGAPHAGVCVAFISGMVD